MKGKDGELLGKRKIRRAEIVIRVAKKVTRAPFVA